MSEEGPSTTEFEVGNKQLTRRRLLATGAGGLAAMYGLGAARASAGLPASLGESLAGTVTLGSYETGPGIKALAATTKKFTAVTGIAVKTNTVDHNTFQNQINCYLQGRPDDVFTWFAGYRMQFFAAKGLATPVDDVWKALTPQMPPSIKAASTGLDGHQYLVPDKNYPWAVYYRKSLWKEKGYTVPKTWDQFIALAKKMQADGLTPIVFTDKDGWPAMGTFDILNMRINGYQFHVDLMAGKESWDSPQAKAVFKQWAELLPYYSKGALGLDVAGRRGAAREQAGRHVPAGRLRGQQLQDGQPGRCRLLPVPGDQLEVGAGLDRRPDRRLHALEEAEEPGRRQEADRLLRDRGGHQHLQPAEPGQPRGQHSREQVVLQPAAEEGSEADRVHETHRAVHGPRHEAGLRDHRDDPVAADVPQQSEDINGLVKSIQKQKKAIFGS